MSVKQSAVIWIDGLSWYSHCRLASFPGSLPSFFRLFYYVRKKAGQRAWERDFKLQATLDTTPDDVLVHGATLHGKQSNLLLSWPWHEMEGCKAT